MIQDLFRNNLLTSIPGYKISFSILEDGVDPPTRSPPWVSLSSATCQRETPPSKSNISINKPHRLLGHGSFGSEVFEGLFEGSKRCAVKVVPDTGVWVEREIAILRDLDSSNNIIMYRTSEVIDSKTSICMELALADLKTYYESGNCGCEFILSEREICMQLVRGVRHLHEQGTAHGDLNPKNILVTVTNSKPVIKIADLGLGSKHDNLLELEKYKTRLDREFGCTYAPEVYKLDKFDIDDYIRADMFSLGCLIAYIMSRGRHDKPIEFLRDAKILKNDLKNHRSAISYEKVQIIRSMNLIARLTDRNPKVRPSIQSVINHPSLWNENKISRFIVTISDYLKTSEAQRTGRPPKMKKIKKKPFTKRLEYINRNRQGPENPVGNQQLNDQEEQRPREMISTEGLTEEQTNSLSKSLMEYRFELSRGLEDWEELLPRELLFGLEPKHWRYDTKCPIDLIRLFRNLSCHFREIREKGITVLGETEDDLERFFSGLFPLLLPIVYELARKFKSSLDRRGEFYSPEEDTELHLNGTSGAYSSLFGRDISTDDDESDNDLMDPS